MRDGRSLCGATRSLALFIPHRQQGLKLRGLGLFVDHRRFDIGEAGFFEHGFHFGFAEAEPLVGVELARFFKAVLDQVEDDDAAAGRENARGLIDGALGVQGVMQRLREKDQIDFASPMGISSMSPRRNSTFLTPWRRACSRPTSIILAEVSTAMTFLARSASSKREGSLARAQIGDDHGRHEP